MTLADNGSGKFLLRITERERELLTFALDTISQDMQDASNDFADEMEIDVEEVKRRADKLYDMARELE